MLPIPTTEPATIQAGDTIQWTRTLADYSAADGWLLSYRFINAAQNLDISSTPQGDAHLVQISAATSAAYTPGAYTWVGHVSRNVERYTVGQGSTTIKPDLAAQVAGFDARGPAQKALEDLRAALFGWLSSKGHVQEYEIAGRRMRFVSAEDLRSRIAIAEREASREALAAGLQQFGRRVLVRF